RARVRRRSDARARPATPLRSRGSGDRFRCCCRYSPRRTRTRDMGARSPTSSPWYPGRFACRLKLPRRKSLVVAISGLYRRAMDDEALLVADYFLATLGVAMMRTVLRDPAAAEPRRHDIERILASLDDPLHAHRMPFSRHGVEEGYSIWAPIYDAPGNPVVANEQHAVHKLLEDAPRGRALDAACGTGRHAAHLVSLGYDVIGVDATPAMLEVARTKVPGADFREGRLENLPVDDASIDVVTCGLALEHADDLGVVMKEFARVLPPGGWVVGSDTHPII